MLFSLCQSNYEYIFCDLSMLYVAARKDELRCYYLLMKERWLGGIVLRWEAG